MLASGGSGNAHFAFGVKNIDVGEASETMLGGKLQMLVGKIARAVVGGVTFDNRAAKLLDERPDEVGLQVAFGALFASRDFDADFAGKFHAERRVNSL